MDVCRHLSSIRLAENHSILNPEQWLCTVCGTTESVWACLSCSNVACGRFNERHALTHFLETKHPLAMEVNDKYVYCYACDDYVINDNAKNIITILRSALSAIATQSFDNVVKRGQSLIRTYSLTGLESRMHACANDKLATADCHFRKSLLRNLFAKWHLVIWQRHMAAGSETPPKKLKVDVSLPSSPGSPRRVRKPTLIPGVTGLRNLGNTCYMNSILQALGHIEDLRFFFLRLSFDYDISSDDASPGQSPVKSSGRVFKRLNTVDCYQHLSSPKATSSPKSPRTSGGLSGGAAWTTEADVKSTETPVKKQEEKMSLSLELHGLFRVLWSGKWAQVSPHAFLQAVWRTIPMFKGHSQHDAQEFLCELVEKVETEGGCFPHCQQVSNMMAELFKGETTSQVKCLSCGNVSSQNESFMDLSLEFPARYQFTSRNKKVAVNACQLTEMLDKFTTTEDLDTESYFCEKCNKRFRSAKSKKYTDAQKQIIVNKLPPVLRLHLKRFRWSGRNHREKISTRVTFSEELDMAPYCSNLYESGMYRLTAVIIHHGRGFGSGHYTSYCYNSEAASWIHCNDAKVELCHLADVLLSQAYILLYTKNYDISSSEIDSEDTSSQSQVIDDDITFNFKHSSLTSSQSTSADTMSRGVKRRHTAMW